MHKMDQRRDLVRLNVWVPDPAWVAAMGLSSPPLVWCKFHGESKVDGPRSSPSTTPQ
ncbi:hypothetical protein GGTG_06959 [Gaeumannomyces tritici R3-111a-1]|uniref:Uncharacterized protein n=1 Tax=Gaeumannomyces tritici (strain R3-111a-1) TaxID=644352 RepID=J3P0B2_GAET3|nr:hypothetical protein GGTG_06959 [Gaeumannomyces tritici R3-111a-1]EJT77045.1 hypothetical protein GGTG_06959 [Gaeumannomyces tritici R3-111a-1]